MDQLVLSNPVVLDRFRALRHLRENGHISEEEYLKKLEVLFEWVADNQDNVDEQVKAVETTKKEAQVQTKKDGGTCQSDCGCFAKQAEGGEVSEGEEDSEMDLLSESGDELLDVRENYRERRGEGMTM